MAPENLPPPPNLFKRGNVWWFIKHEYGGRVRVSTKQRSLEDAVAWLAERPAITLRVRTKPPVFINPYHGAPFTFTDKWIAEIVQRTRYKNKREGLTEVEVRRLIARAAGKCEVTGMPFTEARLPKISRRPFMPSVDRVDSHSPYSLDNCRLVCLSVNMALNQWGDIVFDLMCLARCTTKLATLGHTATPQFSGKALSINSFT